MPNNDATECQCWQCLAERRAKRYTGILTTNPEIVGFTTLKSLDGDAGERFLDTSYPSPQEDDGDSPIIVGGE
jgi:hypothetical protein